MEYRMSRAGWENSTTLLFLLALFLAWPTFGLSFLGFFGWIAWTGYSRGNMVHKREALSLLLEPMFDRNVEGGQGYVRLIESLRLPWRREDAYDGFPEAEYRQCGRLVMLFLANNPPEAAAFIKAMREIDPTDFSAPHETLDYEEQNRQGNDLRLICYRAVEALMTNNDLPCFAGFDLAEISRRVTEMTKEQKARKRRRAAA